MSEIRRYWVENDNGPVVSRLADDGAFVFYTDHLAALTEKGEQDKQVRLFLLVNHGHKAPYLDDGEMQCGECCPNWDYKRLPLKTLISQMMGLRDAQIAALQAKVQELGLSICIPCEVSVCDVVEKHRKAERRIKELTEALEKIKASLEGHAYYNEDALVEIAKAALEGGEEK